jgi:hypothetical protein
MGSLGFVTDLEIAANLKLPETAIHPLPLLGEEP